MLLCHSLIPEPSKWHSDSVGRSELYRQDPILTLWYEINSLTKATLGRILEHKVSHSLSSQNVDSSGKVVNMKCMSVEGATCLSQWSKVVDISILEGIQYSQSATSCVAGPSRELWQLYIMTAFASAVGR